MFVDYLKIEYALAACTHCVTLYCDTVNKHNSAVKRTRRGFVDNNLL